MSQPVPEPPESGTAAEFRWQTFFQHADEPIFLVNRRRRLLFANRAWEACTGLRLADVRGRACRRTASRDREEQVLAALAPPADALDGRPCHVRRRAAAGGGAWWQIGFFPLRRADGLLGILGRITVLRPAGEAAFTLPEKLMALRDRHAGPYDLDGLVGTQPAVQRLRAQARLAAQTRVPVALVGEAGTGQHWLARAIHHAGADRQKYFATLDCARLPAPALEDVLFGPRTSRLSLGAIYLRDPAGLPRELQERLADGLRDENADGPRLFAGFTTDPHHEVKAGRLLEALHCRLTALTIPVPPLRERLADLAWWIDVLLARARELHGHGVRGASAEAEAVLQAHAWPGNVRELAGVLLAAAGRAKGEQLDAADLPFHLRHPPLPGEKAFPLDRLLEEAERRLIVAALTLARNNRTKAAELLQIWRPRLLRRMEHFGLGGENDAAEAAE
jgi:PAS domain S-box-containing protein